MALLKWINALNTPPHTMFNGCSMLLFIPKTTCYWCHLTAYFMLPNSTVRILQSQWSRGFDQVFLIKFCNEFAQQSIQMHGKSVNCGGENGERVDQTKRWSENSLNYLVRSDMEQSGARINYTDFKENCLTGWRALRKHAKNANIISAIYNWSQNPTMNDRNRANKRH